MKPGVSSTSSNQSSVLMCIDDWLIQALDHLQCKVHRDLSIQLYHHRGFLINCVKSCLAPAQLIVWLEMEWVFRTATFSHTEYS